MPQCWSHHFDASHPLQFIQTAAETVCPRVAASCRGQHCVSDLFRCSLGCGIIQQHQTCARTRNSGRLPSEPPLPARPTSRGVLHWPGHAARRRICGRGEYMRHGPSRRAAIICPRRRVKSAHVSPVPPVPPSAGHPSCQPCSSPARPRPASCPCIRLSEYFAPPRHVMCHGLLSVLAV